MQSAYNAIFQFCVETDYGIRLSKKKIHLGWGVNNTSSPFYGQSILTSNFASHSSGPFFLSFFSPINHLLSGVRPMFVSEPTFMQQKFAYDVGLVSTYSTHYYSTFSRFSPTSDLR